MLKKIPNEAYGLSLRLVEVSDAKNIVLLRSNTELTKYMVTVDGNVLKQEEWIREYKKREQLGEDYYFIYQHEEVIAGFARISHINNEKKTCCLSSWIKNPVVKGVGSRMLLSRFDIAFECLNLVNIYASVHKDNGKALRHWRYFDCSIERETDDYNHVSLQAGKYYEYRNSYINNFVLS